MTNFLECQTFLNFVQQIAPYIYMLMVAENILLVIGIIRRYMVPGIDISTKKITPGLIIPQPKCIYVNLNGRDLINKLRSMILLKCRVQVAPVTRLLIIFSYESKKHDGGGM